MIHAFGVEAISLATLYAVCLAFRTVIPFGVLIAAYAMGTLFMIVSITPSGLGFVEGMMTLTFTSLGIPTETAMLVTFFYRGIIFWIPFVVGFGVFRKLAFLNETGEPSAG